MENLSNVLNFYENLGEIDRLHRGLGVVEGARTKELLSRYIEPGMTVYDVGGGAGYYSGPICRGLRQDTSDRFL